ncbi:protein of unknown function [uncultured Woeseiaceae bacterium]|uniref:Uncharacterized protein n=1 Tax=uncultured Woeseiaceae bacterium TaxID=1983305 RepID=A0A7D9D448_9GAMM|nr:protein of unknown function [uncultured Woeseiaceae bacterium]
MALKINPHRPARQNYQCGRIGGELLQTGSYMSNWSPRLNAHKLPVLWPFLLELHVTIALGVQGVVPAHADVDASMNSCAALTNQNAAGVNLLAAKNLDAQAFGFGVPTVFTTAACFFMCH